MKPDTKKIMDEMVKFAREGNEILPAFWQPARGIDASVSAAVRCAVKRGLLIEDGKDGVGKPKYIAPIDAPMVSTAIH